MRPIVLIDTAEKIKRMEIRGAGRIARAAVRALQDEAETIRTDNLARFLAALQDAAGLLVATRPTAVSLPNAVHMVMSSLTGVSTIDEARSRFTTRCEDFIHSSEEAVEHIGTIGSHHIRDGDTILTHCNSEAALACILAAYQSGKEISVFATEVRPGNQGLQTIRSLNEAGIRTNFIVDSAVRFFINEIDLVVVGADAVAVNGAVVNKIGTSQIALAAHEARTNFLVAAETYKFAPRTILGEMITLEERPGSEVLSDELARQLPRVTVRNPVFDVTPPEYIDVIVTEEGAIPPQMAYSIIRDYLGWGMEEFHKEFRIQSTEQE
jgi:ribose 1,5-bisphosphate isomerase